MDVFVRIRSRDGALWHKPFVGTSLIVGKGASCDIILPWGSAARQHCRVFLDDGHYRVRDLGTEAGIWINERRVSRDRDHPLFVSSGYTAVIRDFPADEVRVGNTHWISLLAEFSNLEEEQSYRQEVLAQARRAISALRAPVSAPSARITAALRNGILPTRALMHFACDCAARALAAQQIPWQPTAEELLLGAPLSLSRTLPSEPVLHLAITIMRRYIDEEIGEEDLKAVRGLDWQKAATDHLRYAIQSALRMRFHHPVAEASVAAHCSMQHILYGNDTNLTRSPKKPAEEEQEFAWQCERLAQRVEEELLRLTG